MFGFFNKYDWLTCLAMGAFLLLAGYGVLPMNEAFYKKNHRRLKALGFLALVLSILLVVLNVAAPHSPG